MEDKDILPSNNRLSKTAIGNIQQKIGADQEFSKGAPTLGDGAPTYNFAKFSRKKRMKFWSVGEEKRVLRAPPGSASEKRN